MGNRDKGKKHRLVNESRCLEMVDLAEKPTQMTSTYQEHKIGKTIYRVANEYSGEVNFASLLENLIVQKILHLEQSPPNGGS